MDPYSLISDYVYQGGLPGTLPPDCQAVLNLCSEIGSAEVRNGILELYVHMGIGDSLFPGLTWLQAAVSVIDTCVKAKWPILVHCAAGVSRSGMVVVAYHMKANMWTYDKAMEYVVSKRRYCNPNPNFVIGLKEYEKLLFNKAE